MTTTPDPTGNPLPPGSPGGPPEKPQPCTALSPGAAVVTHLLANWKSTVSSLLTAYVAVFAALSGSDMAASGVVNFHAPEWFLMSGIVAKVLLGLIQTDAK